MRGRVRGKIPPEALGHEIAHYELGHGTSATYTSDPVKWFERELGTWDYALGKASEGEWNRDFVEESLECMVEGVDLEYRSEAKEKISKLLRKYASKFGE